MIAAYDWPGGREAMLRFGPDAGPVVIAALPPFEEANRTRTFVVTLLRALGERGIGGALPDLPGSGDSLVPTEQALLADWQAAFAAAAASIGRPAHALTVRAGALIDGQARLASRWRLAPVAGAALVREMVRTRIAAAREDGAPFDAAALAPPGPPVELAGNAIAREMLAQLQSAVPSQAGPIRTVRLETDAQPADRKVAAAPLWRRAEPDNDPALAALLADDIAAWIVQCAG